MDYKKRIDLVMDECLGTSVEDSLYHYHMLSPCIMPGSTLNRKTYLDLCNDNRKCAEDRWQHALSGYDKHKDVHRVIGIAKDGRFIYGPYTIGGLTW